MLILARVRRKSRYEYSRTLVDPVYWEGHRPDKNSRLPASYPAQDAAQDLWQTGLRTLRLYV